MRSAMDWDSLAASLQLVCLTLLPLEIHEQQMVQQSTPLQVASTQLEEQTVSPMPIAPTTAHSMAHVPATHALASLDTVEMIAQSQLTAQPALSQT